MFFLFFKVQLPRLDAFYRVKDPFDKTKSYNGGKPRSVRSDENFQEYSKCFKIMLAQKKQQQR